MEFLFVWYVHFISHHFHLKPHQMYFFLFPTIDQSQKTVIYCHSSRLFICKIDNRIRLELCEKLKVIKIKKSKHRMIEKLPKWYGFTRKFPWHFSENNWFLSWNRFPHRIWSIFISLKKFERKSFLINFMSLKDISLPWCELEKDANEKKLSGT